MARFYIILPNGSKRRVSICRKSKDEAFEQMRKEQDLARRGAPVIHDGRTVSEWLDYWMMNIAPNKIKQTTLIGYEATIRNHIKPAIGHRTLIGLSPLDVQGMINSFMSGGGSARQAQIIRNTLSSALADGVKRQIVHTNVSRPVDVPQREMKERGYWNPEQCSKFLDSIKSHKFYPIFELYFTYGMRRGEALGLRWRDVDFEGKVIHIRQQLVEMGKHIFVSTPKTTNSKRDLPLLHHIESVLLATREGNESDDDFVFRSRTGTPYQPNNIFRFFRKHVRELGLPVISIHDIRHTVATMMKDSGVPLKDAQMTLGHASPTTTMQHYQHSSLDSKNLALTKIAATVARESA